MIDVPPSDTGESSACLCFSVPYKTLGDAVDLGMDDRFAEISILTCLRCGQKWLRYFYEVEAFTASGRWYLGAISAEQASVISADDAKEILENLNWYFFGGSYYGGRSGKASARFI